jgi:hypothetical protein
VFLRSVLQLVVTANVVPSSLILSTLMKEMVHSSETSVLTRGTWHHIPEDGILHVPKTLTDLPRIPASVACGLWPGSSTDRHVLASTYVHHHVHVLGHALPIPTPLRACCLLHLISARPTFSSSHRTLYFRYDLHFRIVLFRPENVLPFPNIIISYLVLSFVARHTQQELYFCSFIFLFPVFLSLYSIFPIRMQL